MNEMQGNPVVCLPTFRWVAVKGTLTGLAEERYQDGRAYWKGGGEALQ